MSQSRRQIAVTAVGALIVFAAMTVSGAVGHNVRTAFVTAAAVLIGGLVTDRVRSALWALPFLLVVGVFAAFHKPLGSSPALFALVAMGAGAYAVGRSVRPRTATLLALPLAAFAYVAQVNATALTSRTTGEAVDVGALDIIVEGRVMPLLASADGETVFEFWHESCAPCLRNLRDLGAYREEVEIVPVYVPFFESDPKDVRDYLDYPIERQAVLATPWEDAGIDGVPLAVVTDAAGAVCFQGILRDRPLDVVGGMRAVLSLRC